MVLFLSICIGLIAMLAYSLSNITLKPLAQKLGVAQILFLRGISISLILGLLSIPSYHFLLHGSAVIETLLLGVAGYLPVLAFTKGVKNSPVGIVAPIAGTSPLITVVLSFLFLGVAIRPLQWLAIFLVVVANVVVSIDLKNWRQSKLFQVSS